MKVAGSGGMGRVGTRSTVSNRKQVKVQRSSASAIMQMQLTVQIDSCTAFCSCNDIWLLCFVTAGLWMLHSI